MCFKDNVEYLDPPARQSSYAYKPETTTETPTSAKPIDHYQEAKAAVKAAKKAQRERDATIRRKTMYGAGGGAAFIG
ncbi:hypothetical protein TWF481_004181 [Arthrobotrys musiformis]|uniref:Uncharacterized protein n=1 Tax=Arthrobotrys musiformis TaxID=47236 RepID=A0AAV9WKB8_9PEZI